MVWGMFEKDESGTEVEIPIRAESSFFFYFKSFKGFIQSRSKELLCFNIRIVI